MSVSCNDLKIKEVILKAIVSGDVVVVQGELNSLS